MDNKNTHLRQSLNKALSSDSRKTNDYNKQFPKNAKRRENQNLSNTKIDTQRKFGPNKTRANFDKRPKPRSSYNNCSGSTSIATNDHENSRFNILPIESTTSSSRLAENETTSQEDDDFDYDYKLNNEIDLNSIYPHGNKKQNLNHLLNFHCLRDNRVVKGGNIFSRNGAFVKNIKKHRYNKEQFLQANFQFVINLSGKSHISVTSPDTLVDWSLIEQINVHTTEEINCPICLYPPVAAKLTRCGHVYCWPCVLHYLSLSDKSWRKCPICYDAIHVNDLKSMKTVQKKNFIVGDYIKLQLMRREKGSVLVEKVEKEEIDNEIIPYMSTNTDDKKFSKILLAEQKDTLSIIEREKKELMSQFDESCPEFIFIQQALNLLEERRSNMNTDLNESKKLNEETNKVINSDNLSVENQSEEACALVSTTEENNSTGSKTTKDQIHYFYFYQSDDGQNIFLHPLNVKMLQTMYGSLSQGPSFINAKILQKEIQTMNEDLRKKFCCLGHLPLTCQFEIVEVQLEFPIISREVIKMFKDDVLTREKNRLRRAEEELKREKEINEINERQMGKFISRLAKIDIKSKKQFPLCGYEEFPLFDNSNSSREFKSPEQIKFKEVSFANILSTPPEKEFWPSLDGNESSSISTPVWGKISKHSPIKSNSDDISENECGINNDNLNLDLDYNHCNIGDVIADALSNTKNGESENVSHNDNNNKRNKKKKNKNKKTLLFSTGMNFNGNK